MGTFSVFFDSIIAVLVKYRIDMTYTTERVTNAMATFRGIVTCFMNSALVAPNI